MIEDVLVGEASKYEVEEKDADQSYDGKREKLAGNVVARPCRERSEKGGITSGREWWMRQEGDEVMMPQCPLLGDGERTRSEA